MRTLSALLLALSLSSAIAQSNLPRCQGYQTTWTDCYGEHTFDYVQKYIGEFKHGKPDGYGAATSTLDSSFKYVGEWSDGRRNGYGVETNGTMRYKYTGYWREDKKHGQGSETISYSAIGSTYVGEFENGERTINGVAIWDDGSKYVGEYRDGQRSGQGIWKDGNGTIIVGEFDRGLPHGRAITILADGTVKTSGVHVNGKLTLPKPIDPVVFNRVQRELFALTSKLQASKVEELKAGTPEVTR